MPLTAEMDRLHNRIDYFEKGRTFGIAQAHRLLRHWAHLSEPRDGEEAASYPIAEALRFGANMLEFEVRKGSNRGDR